MKLKMNKYKQGAGSDSRLEQDYHKVKTCTDMLGVCFTENMNLQYTMLQVYCKGALCKGHMAHFTSSQACTHAHINGILSMCIGVCKVYMYCIHTEKVT